MKSLAIAAVLYALGGTASADTFVAEGETLLAAGRPRDACVKFDAAYRRDPRSIPASVGLGDCNARQDKLATAARWYRRAIALSSELHAGAGQDPLRERLVAIVDTIPVVELTFSRPLPADAQVLVDGEAVDRTDFPNLELDPGHRVIELVGRGLARTRVEVDAARSGHDELELAVEPVVPVDRGRSRRLAAYALVTGGFALYGTTVAYNLHVQHLYANGRISYADGIRDQRYVGTALFVAGTAALATGVVLYVRAPGVERVAIAPAPGGFVAAGSF